MKKESALWKYINVFVLSQSWAVCDKSERMWSSYPPIRAVSNPVVWNLFFFRIPLSNATFLLVQCENEGKALFVSVIRYAWLIEGRQVGLKGYMQLRL